MRASLALLAALALVPWPTVAAEPVQFVDAGWATCDRDAIALKPVVAPAGASGRVVLLAIGLDLDAAGRGCVFEVALTGAPVRVDSPGRAGAAGIGATLSSPCSTWPPEGCQAALHVPYWMEDGVAALRIPYVILVNGEPAVASELVLVR